ncbi:ATPase [Aureococcus anophagefferens]|nr:ATPase [Aureococcus anophagefferens]
MALSALLIAKGARLEAEQSWASGRPAAAATSSVFFAAIIGVSSVSDAAMPLNVIVGGLAAGANLFSVLGRGQKVAFVGEAAPGRRSCSSCCASRPSGGAILVDGADLRTLGVARWRRTLGYVGQEPVLFQGPSSNIRVSDKAVGGAVRATKMAEALEFVDGLPEASTRPWARAAAP